MSRLTVLGIALAVLIGGLEAMYRIAVDEYMGRAPRKRGHQ